MINANLSSESEMDRCFYAEAQRILKGESGLLVERRHLEAMDEHHQVAMIKISNMLKENWRTVLGMP